MPERFVSSIFVSDTSSLPSRSAVVERLFAASPAWFGSPGEVMRLDFISGAEKHAYWGNLPLLVDEPLSETEILTVYSAPTDASSERRGAPPCISIEERHLQQAVYSVSLPFVQLHGIPSSQMEPWVKRLYSALAGYSECILAASSEAELPSDVATDEVLRYALSPTMGAAWIVAPQSILQRSGVPVPEATIETFDRAVIIRRYDPVIHVPPTGS